MRLGALSAAMRLTGSGRPHDWWANPPLNCFLPSSLMAVLLSSTTLHLTESDHHGYYIATSSPQNPRYSSPTRL